MCLSRTHTSRRKTTSSLYAQRTHVHARTPSHTHKAQPRIQIHALTTRTHQYATPGAFSAHSTSRCAEDTQHTLNTPARTHARTHHRKPPQHTRSQGDTRHSRSFFCTLDVAIRRGVHRRAANYKRFGVLGGSCSCVGDGECVVRVVSRRCMLYFVLCVDVCVCVCASCVWCVCVYV